jgi:hypothetical protein
VQFPAQGKFGQGVLGADRLHVPPTSGAHPSGVAVSRHKSGLHHGEDGAATLAREVGVASAEPRSGRR